MISDHLAGGITIIPALIGLFAIPQVLGMLEISEHREAKMLELEKQSVWASIKYNFSRIKALIIGSVIGIVVGITQQVTGINAVYFYAPRIFEQSGVGTNAAFAQATLIGIINIVFTIIAMLLIDKAGRRPQ